MEQTIYKSESESEVGSIVPLNSPSQSPRVIILEPAVFLLFIAFSLTNPILQNQIIYQACTVVFNFNSSDCLDLGTTDALKDIELTVQPYASKIFVTRTIIESVLPGFLSLFIGPWSDRFGRKPVLLAAFSGYSITYILLITIASISIIHRVNPWWYVVGSMPIALSGGFCSMLTGIFCYITDITNTTNRSMRMSVVECSMFVGLLVGSLACSYVLKYTSTVATLAIAAVMALMATIYLVFGVKESITHVEADRRIGTKAKFGALFDTSLVSDVCVTVFNRREYYERAIVWLTILSLVSCVMVIDGSGTVFYLFVREKFNWTIQQFTVFEASSTMLLVFGNIFGLYLLSKIIGLAEATIAIIAYSSAFTDYTIKALATYSWQLYLGSALSLFKSIASPMCRVILSKVVPPNEIGKIFAVTTSLESLSSLVSAPFYGMVYANTIPAFPGAFNLISAGLFAICVILLILVRIFQNKSQPTVIYGPISD